VGRVLAVTDIHGNWRGLKEVLGSEDYDALFVAGDLSDYSGSADKVVDVLIKHSKSRAYVVIGNMDSPKLIDDLRRYEEVTVLHGNASKFLNYVVVGFSGGLISPFNTAFELDEDSFKELAANAAKSITEVDHGGMLLITHTPPYNTKVDLTYSGMHVGSKVIREFIEGCRPLITICGHIHEGRGYDYVGRTLVINPGPLLRGFYALIEIDGEIKFELRGLK